MLARAGAARTTETKQRPTLPKKGALCFQWVRCGRPTCRCVRGGLHGPYRYLFWRDGGRLHKQYVRMADTGPVQAACQRRREAERAEREAARAGRQEWRRMLALIREVERHG